MTHYLIRVGIALSILLNVLLGGYSNQTFSARNHAWKRAGLPNIVWLIDGMFCIIGFIATKALTFGRKRHTIINLSNHCMRSWIYWRARKDVRENLEISLNEEKTLWLKVKAENLRELFPQESIATWRETLGARCASILRKPTKS